MYLRGRLLLFIKNFLSERKIRVRVGTSLSDFYGQEMGVPQGSILSVTLLVVKINSITSCIKNGVDKSLFVDEFGVSYRSKHMHALERQLQLHLNRIEDWADKNGFKFSQSKTVCVHFCQRRGLHPDHYLVLYDNPIPVKKETKFLGILLDSKLTFVHHIKGLKKKCVKALNLFRVVSNNDWGGDRTVLLRLYRALVRSKLDYGCFIYGAACKSYISLLDPIQNQSFRLSLGAFRTSPAQSLCVEAIELPLHLRREKLALQFATKIAANPNNPVYDTIFNPWYVDLFARKPRVIPTFGIRIKESLEELDFDPDIIAKFEIPESPPWIYQTAMVNLTLSYAKKGQTDPLKYISLHNEVKDVFREYDFIYSDGSCFR